MAHIGIVATCTTLAITVVHSIGERGMPHRFTA
jgi:hypothetical protein